MKTLAPKLFILAFAISLLSCSSDNSDDLFVEDVVIVIEDEVITVEETSSYKYSEIESEISDLINSHRENIGLTSLIPLDAVSEVAESHSNYMVETGKLSHDNFSERAKELISNENAISVGENVASGFTTAEGAVNGWLSSPGHKSVIENSKFTHFGVSTETDSNGRNYYTQIFIAK